MKKILTYLLLTISTILCGCPDQNYGESCSKSDSSVSMNFVANEAVDSVKFWVNGSEFCRLVEESLFVEKRGEQGYQGKREEFVVSNDSNRKVFVCAFGIFCDKLGHDFASVNFDGRVFVEVFSAGKVDTVLLEKPTTGTQYRVFSVSDSSAASVLSSSRYGAPVCNGGYCIEERLGSVGMCIDSMYNDDVYKNACTGGWIKDF